GHHAAGRFRHPGRRLRRASARGDGGHAHAARGRERLRRRRDAGRSRAVAPTPSYTPLGECVAMLHDARRGETRALSGQGTASALATIPFFQGRGLDRIPTGPGADAHLSFTVPGAIDAYLTLLEVYGTRKVSEVLAPALQYAERGFPMYEYMQRMLGIPESRNQFDLYPPGGHDVFYPGGGVPTLGQLLVQPALAGTLRRIAEADTQGRGHRLAGAGGAAPWAGARRGWAGCSAPPTSPTIARRSRRHCA